jgi:uncharacterized protein DUF4386
MSAVIPMERSAEPSPHFNARAGGVFWLLTIVSGMTAMICIRGIIVSGDAAATSANILAHASTLRWGVASNLIAAACYVAATLFVYELLKPVSRNVSLLAAFFSLIGCAVGASKAIFQLAPLVLLTDPHYQSAFSIEQVQSMAFLSLRIGGQASNIDFLFFGLHVLLVGCLIVRSNFLPRTVGVLMILGGLGWLTQSLTGLLSPPLARALSMYVMLPGMVGEVSLTLWLLVMPRRA